MKTTNEKAGILANKLIPFDGSNLYGIYVEEGEIIPYFGRTEYNCYVIYSYRTAILGYVNGVWIANKQKYSRSTSRQLTDLEYYIDIKKEVIGEKNLLKEIAKGGLYGELKTTLEINNNVKPSISKI